MENYNLDMGTLKVGIVASDPSKLRGTPNTWELSYTATTFVGRTAVQVIDILQTRGFPDRSAIEAQVRDKLTIAIRELYQNQATLREKPSELE